MTSISTTSVTVHLQPTRTRTEAAAETTAPMEPIVSARVQAQPSVETSASSPAQDAFLSKVFDILHKMHEPVEAAASPALDAEDVQAMIGRIGAQGEVTSSAFVSARPDHVSEAEAARLFASLDVDGRGALSLDRLASAFSQDTAEDDGNILSTLDSLGALSVDRDQFLASMQQTETPDDAVKSLLRLLGGKDHETDQG